MREQARNLNATHRSPRFHWLLAVYSFKGAALLNDWMTMKTESEMMSREAVMTLRYRGTPIRTSMLQLKFELGISHISTIISYFYTIREPEYLGCNGDWLWASWVRVRVPVEASSGFEGWISTSSRLVLGPTQSPIQWAPAGLSPQLNRPGAKLTTPPTNVEVKNT
jgi:hypothetical protein